MELQVLDAMAREGFEMVIALHDRRSRLAGFLALHDTSVGPALGGIRRWCYRSEAEALRDCLRLARAMTQKCALADLAAGGAKLVLMDRPGVDWQAAYEHVGQVVESLGGRFRTGPDVGTGERELGWVASRTSYVTRPGPDGPGELAASTAEGVFAGMGAALRHLDGSTDWARRRVVVQGVGEVGRRLAARLSEHGARVLCSDVDADRAASAAAEHGLEVSAPSRELEVPCDVFAPCALGGVLHDLSMTRLRCRVVAGAANNVLARSAHADRLHALGILHAPDVLISSGALIRGATFELEGRREPVPAIGRVIASRLAAVFEQAREADVSPVRVAAAEASRRLAARRAPRAPILE